MSSTPHSPFQIGTQRVRLAGRRRSKYFAPSAPGGGFPAEEDEEDDRGATYTTAATSGVNGSRRVTVETITTANGQRRRVRRVPRRGRPRAAINRFWSSLSHIPSKMNSRSSEGNNNNGDEAAAGRGGSAAAAAIPAARVSSEEESRGALSFSEEYIRVKRRSDAFL